MNTRVIPGFQTEAEEARWWFDHDEELTDDFEQATADDAFHVAATGILLPHKDADLARAQAAVKGLDYQAYLATLVHEALQRASISPEPHFPRILLDLPLNGTR